MSDNNKSKRDTDQDFSQDWGFSRPLFKNPWFYFAVTLIVLLTVTRPFFRRIPAPLPVLQTIPEFSFIQSNGERFGSRELAGKPYVASFIFTRCQTSCPLVSQKMAELQKQFLDGGLPVRLVSFTVDPEFDRPQVLHEFAESYKAVETSWKFLTASESESSGFISFLESSFAVGIGEPMPLASEAAASGSATEVARDVVAVTAMDIAHSERLLLVDSFGRLRGYFSASADGINEIFDRSVALMGEREPK